MILEDMKIGGNWAMLPSGSTATRSHVLSNSRSKDWMRAPEMVLSAERILWMASAGGGSCFDAVVDDESDD